MPIHFTCVISHGRLFVPTCSRMHAFICHHLRNILFHAHMFIHLTCPGIQISCPYLGLIVFHGHMSMLQGLGEFGFGVWVQGLGLGFQGLKFRVQCIVYRVQGVGFRVDSFRSLFPHQNILYSTLTFSCTSHFHAFMYHMHFTFSCILLLNPQVHYTCSHVSKICQMSNS